MQKRLAPDNSINKRIGNLFEDEEFTKNSSDISSADESNVEREKSMVVALTTGVEGLKHKNKLHEEELRRQCEVVAEKLPHLNEKEHANMEKMLHEEEILAWSHHDLRNAEAPVQHT